MTDNLFWSERALKEYKNLMNYLLEEWGEKIRDRVISELDKSLTRIQHSPEQFPFFSKRKGVRRCVASPQTSTYFKKTKEHIEIYSFFDNRQDPKKRRL